MRKHLLSSLAIAATAIVPAGIAFSEHAVSATTVVAPIFPKCCFKFTPSLTASSGGDFSGVVVQGSLFQPERTVRIELYDQKTGVPLNYTYLPSNNTGSFTWDDVPDFHLYCNENLEVRAYDTVTARWIYTTGTAGCKIR